MRAHTHARGREVIDQPSAADAGGADGPVMKVVAPTANAAAPP
jgi:hypothetical protein